MGKAGLLAPRRIAVKRLFDDRVKHANEEYRESMLKHVRLNREIMETWAFLDPEPVEGEHGKPALSEAPLSERQRVEGRSESKGKAVGEGDAS